MSGRGYLKGSGDGMLISSEKVLNLPFLLVRFVGGRQGSNSMRSVGGLSDNGGFVAGKGGRVRKEVANWDSWSSTRASSLLSMCVVEVVGVVADETRSQSGDDSLEEMSIMLVRATFLGGFLVEDEVLEAILKVD
ncbi:hypothetical protein Tco_0472273 [Tanacetum coccineum]